MMEVNKHESEKSDVTNPALKKLMDMVSKFDESKDLPAPYDEPQPEPMMVVKTANEWINDAYDRPDPQPLWDCLWNEGEVCCLFADSNLGKSIYAVQIGAEIAKSQKVLYFDFELSDKQFQLRYSEAGEYITCFPDNFLRCEMNVNYYCDGNFEDAVMQNIENTAVSHGARVIIIDNLTWLCNASEKGDSAGILMKKLMTLKARYGWSILVISHTPKRSLSSPITQNDLAGSKKLFNFFDSVFAIGQSARDSRLRYIKQLKVRSGEFAYDADNVITAEITKAQGFVGFNYLGYDTERNHLKEQSDSDEESMFHAIQKQIDQGMTYAEIGLELGISASKVCRLLKKYS